MIMMYTTTLGGELYGLAIGDDHQWYKVKVIEKFQRSPRSNSVWVNRYADEFEKLTLADLKELDG